MDQVSYLARIEKYEDDRETKESANGMMLCHSRKCVSKQGQNETDVRTLSSSMQLQGGWWPIIQVAGREHQKQPPEALE